MKPISISIWPLVLVLPSILAGEVKISQKRDEVQQCQGMYGQKAWGGDTDPFILTKLIKATPEDNSEPQVSLIVFEWKDEDLVGVLAKAEDEKVGMEPSRQKTSIEGKQADKPRIENAHLRRRRDIREILRKGPARQIHPRTRCQQFQESHLDRSHQPQRPQSTQI